MSNEDNSLERLMGQINGFLIESAKDNAVITEQEEKYNKIRVSQFFKIVHLADQSQLLTPSAFTTFHSLYYSIEQLDIDYMNAVEFDPDEGLSTQEDVSIVLIVHDMINCLSDKEHFKTACHDPSLTLNRIVLSNLTMDAKIGWIKILDALINPDERILTDDTEVDIDSIEGYQILAEVERKRLISRNNVLSAISQELSTQFLAKYGLTDGTDSLIQSIIDAALEYLRNGTTNPIDNPAINEFTKYKETFCFENPEFDETINKLLFNTIKTLHDRDYPIRFNDI